MWPLDVEAKVFGRRLCLALLCFVQSASLILCLTFGIQEAEQPPPS